MTPEQRSRCMAAVKGRDTKPELMVRRYLFAHGLRYRVNVASMPGKPDIVLRKYHTVVFVNGCFWHGHQSCPNSHLPKSNADFWRQKINLNIARDYRVDVDLRLDGWRVIRVWECQLTPTLRKRTLSSLLQAITMPHTSTYTTAEPPPIIAAEPITGYSTGKKR